MRRPLGGRLPFLVLRFERENKGRRRERRWERGKPGFGFPLSHGREARAVGMWKSRVVGEISKGRWNAWESCFCFSTLSTDPAFPQPFFLSVDRRRPGRRGKFKECG